MGCDRPLLGHVLVGEVANRQRPRSQLVKLRRVAREGHLDELRERRLDRTGVPRVRYENGPTVDIEARELPRSIHRCPDRVRGVGGQDLRLAVQEIVNLDSCRGCLVVALNGTRGRDLVHRLNGQRRYLRELVVGEPSRVDGVRQMKHNRRWANNDSALHVVRVVARRVGGPVCLVGRHQVLPELDVCCRHRGAVGPHVMFQSHRHRGIAVRVDRSIRDAHRVVQNRVCPHAEEVKRTIQEELQEQDVVEREVRQAVHGEYVVRRQTRKLCKGGCAS